MVRQSVVGRPALERLRIVDIGVCPVPTSSFMVRHVAHRWHRHHGEPQPGRVERAQVRRRRRLFLSGERGPRVARTSTTGRLHEGERRLHARHRRTMPAAGDPPTWRHSRRGRPAARRPGGRRLRVALDSCNGAGSVVTPRLIGSARRRGRDVNVTPDGSFPRPAEPLPEHLGTRCRPL